MKSDRAAVVLAKKIQRKIIRGVLELIAMKQRRDWAVIHTVGNPAADKFCS